MDTVSQSREQGGHHSGYQDHGEVDILVLTMVSRSCTKYLRGKLLSFLDIYKNVCEEKPHVCTSSIS